MEQFEDHQFKLVIIINFIKMHYSGITQWAAVKKCRSDMSVAPHWKNRNYEKINSKKLTERIIGKKCK